MTQTQKIITCRVLKIHAGVGWGGSCRDGGRVGHAGCDGSCRSGMGHAGVGWGGSYRGWVSHAGMGCGWSYQCGVGWELQDTESRNATGYQT